MKRSYIKKIVLFGIFAGMMLTGCYYDSEEELYGTNCNTSQVTYSQTIKGILSGYGCLGCHSGSTANAGVNLDSYPGITSNINRVWGAINHLGAFEPMPQGGSKMSTCDINKVKAWIDAGMPNN